MGMITQIKTNQVAKASCKCGRWAIQIEVDFPRILSKNDIVVFERHVRNHRLSCTAKSIKTTERDNGRY